MALTASRQQEKKVNFKPSSLTSSSWSSSPYWPPCPRRQHRLIQRNPKSTFPLAAVRYGFAILLQDCTVTSSDCCDGGGGDGWKCSLVRIVYLSNYRTEGPHLGKG
eukprot:750788-Hanusia_phi.AAC.1